MDPRLVVALFDLPSDADVSALVLRFGVECELVWLNDKNALVVFSDPARAATAMRQLDHGSVNYGVAHYHHHLVMFGLEKIHGNTPWTVNEVQ
ncbi:putative nucleotide-binding alpha-beta plait domain superfamily, transcription factor NFX1 family [Helianthus debilis subsp. tardiflorus]